MLGDRACHATSDREWSGEEGLALAGVVWESLSMPGEWRGKGLSVCLPIRNREPRAPGESTLFANLSEKFNGSAEVAGFLDV